MNRHLATLVICVRATLVIFLNLDLSKETVHFVVQARSEEELVTPAREAIIPERQSPETIDRDRITVLVRELALEGPRRKIESIDATIPEVADQQAVAELAKIVRCDHQAPRRVERAMRREASEQIALGIEDTHETMPRARLIVVLVRLLQRKGHEQVAVDGLDAEGSKTLVGERTISRQHRVGEGLDEIELTIEHLDRPETEVGRINEVAGTAAAKGEPFVNCALAHHGAIYFEDGIGRIDGGIPPRDRSVFGRKEENARAGLRAFRNDEGIRLRAVPPVEDDARRGGRRCSPHGRRDSDHARRACTRECCAVPTIRRGVSTPIVRDHPRAGRAVSQAPRVDQIRVLEPGTRGKIRDQVHLSVGSLIVGARQLGREYHDESQQDPRRAKKGRESIKATWCHPNFLLKTLQGGEGTLP